MPWQPNQAQGKTKAAKTAADQKLWSAVANKVLNQTGQDATAIKIANAKVRSGKMKKKGVKKHVPVPPQFRKQNRAGR